MTESRKRADEDYGPASAEDEEFLFDDDDDYEDDGDGYEEDDEEALAWRLRPEWLHPECRNTCSALELGTCCKYPDNPLIRVAVDLAESVDALLGRLDGDCGGTEPALGRTLMLIPGLLAQIHAILPRLNRTAIAQLLCPVGRLASALEQVCGGGCPWACSEPTVPDRRAEFAPLIELVMDCSVAVRTALGRQLRPGRDSGSYYGPGRGSGVARR